MKIALAQINTTVGDLAGNEAKILAAQAQGVATGVDWVVLPELTLTGYPPRDLALSDGFIAKNLEALERLARQTGSTGLVVGFIGRNEKLPGRKATNAVALLQNGKVQATRTKSLLPTYDVFDEDRYFEPATENVPVIFAGEKIGLTICEDLWNDEDFWRDRRYRRNPAADLVANGAKLIVNASASPWHLGKNQMRQKMLSQLAAKSRCAVVYCNLVGGNDELIFDGTSLVFNAHGELLAEGRRFAEDFIVVDLAAAAPVTPAKWAEEEMVYRALVLGTRDYLHKCGFQSAVLGLSGGIDSALVAAIAAEALGRENVRGVALPSQYSSPGSLDDARRLAKNLGIRYDEISIQPLFAAAKEQLKTVFAGYAEDVTEENLQARARGLILMACSNKFGSLLLTTGNKSEMAVGYCTLYGDMCGGLAVICDVPKTMVYRIAQWLNRDREVIPPDTIAKPPSAELRPNQTDQDSLPPYDVLDAIAHACIVEGRTMAEIIAVGHAPADVRRVVRLIQNSEYKRRQAAPGLKVTTKAFGLGRRVPVAQKHWESA